MNIGKLFILVLIVVLGVGRSFDLHKTISTPRHQYDNKNALVGFVVKTSVLGLGTILRSPKVSTAAQDLVYPPDCGDSVLVLRGVKGDVRGREVVVIGTAHISEESADVVRRSVSALQPDVVMIELDQKRLGRVVDQETGKELTLADRGFVLPNVAANNNDNPSSLPGVSTSGGGGGGGVMMSTGSSGSSAMLMESSTQQQQQQQQQRQQHLLLSGPVGGFLSAIANRAKALAGRALKVALGQFYSSVEKLGFTAGQEFIVAVQEAKKVTPVSAKVLLGDQDVDVTLQNLAAALSMYANDADRFLALVESIENKERELGIDLPTLTDSGSSNGNIGGGGGGGGDVSKAQMAAFVEKLKTREALETITSTLKAEAPAVYDAMIGDRDIYMAQSIVGQRDSQLLVAVCGMAHLAGIERQLCQSGFEVAARKC